MADEKHLALLKRSVVEWNAWRRKKPEILADLSGAKLRGADLSGANLSGADLIGANLNRAELIGTNLNGADLTAANLSGARLWGAIFLGTKLGGADLRDAAIFETVFVDLDLSATKNLDTCKHHGPSTIDHRTLQRSGPLPLSFLRGCGLPERFIEYLPSIFDQPIQFYSCFISYATADEEFARRLHADLQDESVRCWFAPEDLKIGDELRPTFDEAIRLRDKLVVVLSETSIARPWVKREVEQALDEEQRRGQTVLFPIRLDDAVLDATAGWATDVKRRHIGDFRRWKDHDSYRSAFERLLRDLKIEV